jgi:hypothetical protein
MYVMGYHTGGLTGLYASDDLQATNLTDQSGDVWAISGYPGYDSLHDIFGPNPTTTPINFLIDPTLASDAEPQLCPTSITVQDGQGGIAAAPVITVVDPN